MQERQCAAALHAEFAHVGHVEHTGGVADGVVFGFHARVLHGHVPPAEGHHSGSGAQVRGMQGRPLQRLGGGLVHT
ncbi:hypothetical protein GCM10008959_11460 [Deinococcus seoulensis]|uniref:Uncharacterized protein n=1 Tax=Deinococcus seoulensis TaxID=1837379 RepID=A0ABQ2RS82_9DEIO|nr:hypothetical protein GCM10008959_11460 [Deinococcus seoulensis]